MEGRATSPTSSLAQLPVTRPHLTPALPPPLLGPPQLDDAAKAKPAASGNPMDVYFNRLKRLRENGSLESRIRFAIQDVLDLRTAR
jgi:hypothetical protein